MRCVAVSVIIVLGVSSIFARNLDELSADDDLLVQTTTGWVRGGYGGLTAGKGRTVYRFRGIPFAEPPVGNLRFEPPVPKKSWEGVLDVSEKGAECLQGTDPVVGSEDCLYLKVYTTSPPREHKKLPVLVWIYGGAFFAGAPDFEDHSPDHLLDEDIIVVSFHYRVGIFGFLSTGDLVVPGNNGLKDQVAALKWLKQNVESFGGDPDRITIFGQSAGGASVAYLLQTEKTKDLINGAILQSGASLSLWSLSRIAPEVASTVAKDLDLQTTNSQVIVDGLKSVDAEELQKVSMSSMLFKLLTNNPRDGLLFVPVVEPKHEGAILTEGSYELLKEGKFHDVPIVMGYNSLEALLEEIPELLRIWLLTYDLQASKLVPVDMNIASLLTRNTVGRQIKSQYFGSGLVSTSTREVMEFISDDQFERPIQQSALLYAAKTPVYFYRFSYEGPLWGVTNRTGPGVGHTEELGYLFDFKYAGSEQDYLTRDRLVRLWANFAKTGNPTPERDPLLQNVIWEPNFGTAENSDLKSLEINRDLQLTVNPNTAGISFWKDLYRSYGAPPYDTY